jgi:hypothetical protein
VEKYIIALILLLLSYSSIAEETARLNISDFSTEQLNGWKSKEFKGKTDYQIIQMDGKTVLKAESTQNASGLFKEQHIDLYKTPYLNWSWRIDTRLGNLNEQEKSGDDYAARVYVVIDGGWTFWNTKAINYVWASNTAKGEIWPNAFAGDHAMMIALRSVDDPLYTWQTEKRNILQDLQRLYGDRIRYIDAVAIMTDTDNAKGKATAFYADIYFTEN